MLDINKNITISGTSMVNGVQVAYLSASVSTDGVNCANINKSISNQDLYNANKAEVRKDMAEFEAEVYKVEDEQIKAAEVQVLKLEKAGR